MRGPLPLSDRAARLPWAGGEPLAYPPVPEDGANGNPFT